MNPLVALSLTCALVAYLFWRDVHEKPNITGALWIPLIWMLISGSRQVTVWLAVFGFPAPSSLEDGSPVDRIISSALIVAGIYVLGRRETSILKFLRANKWLSAYLAYCCLAIVWSDFPFVSFKRWIRTIGEPVMVMVLLTEPDRHESLIRLVKRCTYVLAPFSIMLIKYFPNIGKHFSAWGGGESSGVTGGKNALGYVCLVLGYFLFCHVVKTLKFEKSDARRNELILSGFLLWMIWWNLIEASSSTSLVALIIGMGTVVFLGSRFVNRRFVGVYVVAGVLLLVAADAVFGLYAAGLTLLGEDSTLTGRTDLWQDLLAMNTNPIIGTGFESFWLGARLEHIWKLHWWMPNEAHNGYLEVYLNLGLVGLFLVLCVVIATYRKGRMLLAQNFEEGRLRLGFLAAAIVYNWTEAAFRPLHFVLFAFYMIAIDYPIAEARPALAVIAHRRHKRRAPEWSMPGRPWSHAARVDNAATSRTLEPSGNMPRFRRTNHANRVYRSIPRGSAASASPHRPKPQSWRNGED